MNLNQLVNHILDADRNQSIMARSVLNLLGRQDQWPVDLSELSRLSPENIMAVASFLEWWRWNSHSYGDVSSIADFVERRFLSVLHPDSGSL